MVELSVMNKMESSDDLYDVFSLWQKQWYLMLGRIQEATTKGLINSIEAQNLIDESRGEQNVIQKKFTDIP